MLKIFGKIFHYLKNRRTRQGPNIKRLKIVQRGKPLLNWVYLRNGGGSGDTNKDVQFHCFKLWLCFNFTKIR